MAKTTPVVAAGPVIQVHDVVKRFGGLIAVDHVSFEVLPGEVLGILGPNGAGKTTLLEIIEGIQKPTTGSTMVLGHNTQQDPGAVKERVGVQLQASAYFEYLTLVEVLDLFGSFYRHRAAPRELLEQVSLLEKAGTTVGKLSGGQRQRFTIAASLVNQPEVVILDEPTTGLDPQARRNVWELIRQIHGQGHTIVLTTHYMEEAEQLCHRVAIMDEGKLVALDTPEALVRRMERPYRMRVGASAPVDFSGLADVVPIRVDDVTYEFQASDVLGLLAQVQRLTEAQGSRLEHLEVVPATLEDVFLDLTGHELRD